MAKNKIILEDNLGNEVIPVTDTDSVFMMDYNTKLTDKLKNFDTSLETKMQKGDSISVTQINKNLGKLDETYFTDEFLEQMAGNTPISSTVADKSITNQKLADGVFPYFLYNVSTEMNYINNNTLTLGGLKADGTVDTTITTNSTTDYILITPNTTIFRLNTNPVVVGFYTSDRTFIRRDTVSTKYFATPENTRYMRYASATESVKSEVLSLFPVTYYTPFDTIAKFKLGDKYKFDIPTIYRNGLGDNFLDLSLNRFLNSTDNLNSFTKDGVFIGINSLNAPTTGTFIYENKGLKNGSDVRWIIQSAINLNNLNDRYIRKIDVVNSANNTKWININISNSSFIDKKFIFFGDSITQGVGSTDESTKSYPAVLQRKYGLNVTNAGISGATAGKYGDGYDDISLLTQIDNANLTNIDYAFIFIGTNDFGRGNTGRVIGEKDSMLENTFTGALNVAVKKILSKNPKIKILFITPMWRQRIAQGDNKDSDFNQYDGKFLMDYVNAMIQQGKYNHIKTLNLYDNCLINKYNYATYLTDGLHPNDYGYEYLADVFFKFLSSTY